MSDNIKKMDLKEFVDRGYLLEVNRNFFHLLGLALAMQVDEETGEAKLAEIWDFRNEPEGIIFAEELLDKIDKERAERISDELKEKSKIRLERFGWIVQPITN